ncbi:unnamed protein product [Darwinula stevensoni]|uniref:Uncharacterized protein n=1 Tax=Darwinula stevensoni TaxID=69355 RepID=A0A7R8XJG5_9CRUS|nr:unnamed protein product [Darwinula stevensoni]CAG0895320.1 unnamed protein product [Darwinula stevensoni]
MDAAAVVPASSPASRGSSFSEMESPQKERSTKDGGGAGRSQEGKKGDCCVPGWEWGELSENPAWLLEHLAQGIHMVVAEEQSVQAIKGSHSESGAIFTM